jgi:hypothetical protein
MVNVTYYIDKSNTNKKGFSPVKANITINYKNLMFVHPKTGPFGASNIAKQQLIFITRCLLVSCLAQLESL